MPSVIGVDLGGTKIAAARYDISTWTAQATEHMGTQVGKPFALIVQNILAVIEKLKTKDTAAIGIGVPGLIHRPSGMILTLPNIPGAENFPLQYHIAKEAYLPTTVDNDSSCFTLAEALHGAGKGHDIVVGITMGTGVGGGIVMNGKLFHGSHGFSAEFGHMLLKPGEPPYETPDRRGDVEQFISGTAMGRRCTAAKDPVEYLEGEICAFLHPHIIEEVAWTCANLTHCIDPAIIIFGGSAGRALAPYLKSIADTLTRWVLPGTPLPALTVSALPDAGTRGAALITEGR
jgi:predicted NBD/HSP70 family sugar kinase